MKQCRDCRKRLPLDRFHKNKAKKDGLYPICKDCRSARSKAHYAANKDRLRAKQRAYQIKSYYGLSEEEYDAKLAATRRCPLCHGPGPFHLDHDHTTGAVREFLCGKCNRAIGMLGEDIPTLLRTIDYLERHRGGNDVG